MKNNGITAAAVILLIMLAAPSRSADAMQTQPETAAAARIAESPLMKAVQSTASIYRSREKVTQFEDNLNWINETRTTNQYQDGRLTSRQEDVWDGGVIGDWTPFMLYEYSYHPDGTLASETVFEFDGAEFQPFERTLYEGEGSVFSRILVQAPDGAGGWADVEQTVYTLQDGLVVAGQTDLWLGEWSPQERFTYEGTDTSVTETIQRPDGASWMNAERIIYPGLNLYYLHQEFERLLNEYAELEGMYYAIRLPESVSQNWDGAQWVNEFRVDTNASYELYTGYKLDETMLTEEWDGAEWVPVSKTFIEFVTTPELYGLPSSLVVQIHDGNDWVDLFQELYILQSGGVRKIAQSTLSMDLGSGMQEVSRVRLDWVEMPSVGVEDPEAPATFTLDQNYPNPFNPTTRIDYTLKEAQSVQLSVFDVLGRRVSVLDSGVRPVGAHSVTWDAAGMPSGTYLYRLETAGGVVTRTMMLLK